MNILGINNSELVIFKPKEGGAEFQVVLDGEHDTVWATEQQVMNLFGKAKRTGEHINKALLKSKQFSFKLPYDFLAGSLATIRTNENDN